jgi:hypothetical protein
MRPVLFFGFYDLLIGVHVSRFCLGACPEAPSPSLDSLCMAEVSNNFWLFENFDNPTFQDEFHMLAQSQPGLGLRML